jgi:hypothetical protein
LEGQLARRVVGEFVLHRSDLFQDHAAGLRLDAEPLGHAVREAARSTVRLDRTSA